MDFNSLLSQKIILGLLALDFMIFLILGFWMVTHLLFGALLQILRPLASKSFGIFLRNTSGRDPRNAVQGFTSRMPKSGRGFLISLCLSGGLGYIALKIILSALEK